MQKHNDEGVRQTRHHQSNMQKTDRKSQYLNSHSQYPRQLQKNNNLSCLSKSPAEKIALIMHSFSSLQWWFNTENMQNPCGTKTMGICSEQKSITRHGATSTQCSSFESQLNQILLSAGLQIFQPGSPNLSVFRKRSYEP